MYAARLTWGAPRWDGAGGTAGPAWFPERWTLDGPEPYRVPLPTGRSERPGSEVLPMADGRVLIHRTQGHRHVFALLHPTSPGTREIPLGAVACPAYADAAGDAHTDTEGAGAGYAAEAGYPARSPYGDGATRPGDAVLPGASTTQGRRSGNGHLRDAFPSRRGAAPDRSPGGVWPGDPSGLPGRTCLPVRGGRLADAGSPPSLSAAKGGPMAREGCTAVRLLPPVPGGRRAYALAVGARSTTLWLVAGGPSGPRRLAELPGRCSGGVWLERTGRLLAVDQEKDGRVKTVTVDLGRGCAVSPFLEITEDSNDRLLLADPDSGLLLIRSDAPSPGHERLAWAVLGSTLPVRFPECLRLADCAVTPFAIQPGQTLTPERCAVALRIDGAAGTWLGLWRPGERALHHVPAPGGWLTGCGAWTREGVLRLPYATREVPCGVARVSAPQVHRPLGHGPVRTGTAAAAPSGSRATVPMASVAASPGGPRKGPRPGAPTGRGAAAGVDPRLGMATGPAVRAATGPGTGTASRARPGTTAAVTAVARSATASTAPVASVPPPVTSMHRPAVSMARSTASTARPAAPAHSVPSAPPAAPKRRPLASVPRQSVPAATGTAPRGHDAHRGPAEHHDTADAAGAADHEARGHDRQSGPGVPRRLAQPPGQDERLGLFAQGAPFSYDTQVPYDTQDVHGRGVTPVAPVAPVAPVTVTPVTLSSPTLLAPRPVPWRDAPLLDRPR